MSSLIERQAAIEAFAPYAEYESNRTNAEWVRRINMVLSALPPAQPEPEEFEWCHTCREYDQEKHCCHRWTKVIRKTVDDMKAAQPGWIPCSRELPKKDGDYLVTTHSGQIARYIFIGGSSEEYWRRCATAWMPLPTPYREGGQDDG